MAERKPEKGVVKQPRHSTATILFMLKSAYLWESQPFLVDLAPRCLYSSTGLKSSASSNSWYIALTLLIDADPRLMPAL